MLLVSFSGSSLGSEYSIYGTWFCSSKWQTESFFGLEEVTIKIGPNQVKYRQTGKSTVKSTEPGETAISILRYELTLDYEFEEPDITSTINSFKILSLSDELNFFDEAVLKSFNAKGRKMNTTLTFVDNNKLISESETGAVYDCAREK